MERIRTDEQQDELTRDITAVLKMAWDHCDDGELNIELECNPDIMEEPGTIMDFVTKISIYFDDTWQFEFHMMADYSHGQNDPQGRVIYQDMWQAYQQVRIFHSTIENPPEYDMVKVGRKHGHPALCIAELKADEFFTQVSEYLAITEMRKENETIVPHD